jgi:hypothetical protein
MSFFEITGDEGQIWVTRATGEMLDLAPVLLFSGTANPRSVRRWGRRPRAQCSAITRPQIRDGAPLREVEAQHCVRRG